MKRIAFLAVILFVAPAVAHASHSSGLPETKVEPGTLGYGLMQAQEAISLFLTFDASKKAHKRVKFAQKRLSIAKRMAEENRTEEAKKAMNQYDNHIRRAKAVSEGLPPEKRQDIKDEINATTSKEVLGAVLEKVPRQARKGIMTAMESIERAPILKPDSSGKKPGKNTSPEARKTAGEEVEGFVASGRVIPESGQGR